MLVIAGLPCARYALEFLQTIGEQTVPHSYSRRTFLGSSLMAGATLTGVSHLARATTAGNLAVSSSKAGASIAPPKPAFPVADYHVHLSDHLSIEQAVNLSKERQIRIGIVEHPGPGNKLNSDAELKQYIRHAPRLPRSHRRTAGLSRMVKSVLEESCRPTRLRPDGCPHAP